MKNRRRITGIVTAMLLAFIGTVALVGYVRSAKDNAAAKEALVKVYIVDKLVPKGAEPETIKTSVSLEEVPARLKQTGALTDLSAVGTNVAATDLQPGDQLLEARLVPKEKVAEGVTDKVQISTILAAERAVGGSLQKGDLVGVYLSFDPFTVEEAGEIDASAPTTTSPAADVAGTDTSTPVDTQKKTPSVTRLEFQHVLVTNVQTTDTPVEANTNDTTAVAQVTGRQFVVTLALSPEQSERFVFASEFGHVWLSNDPASVSDDGTRLVTLGNVYRVVK